MRKTFSLAFVVVLSLVLLTACGGSGQTVETSPDNLPDAQAGKTLYENFCLSCHGPAGKGDGPAAASLQPKPSDLSALQQTSEDNYLFSGIAQGKDGTAMTAWKNILSETQIWQIVAYLRTLE